MTTTMVEQETVNMTKEVSRTLSEEMQLMGLVGRVSRADFLGALLSDALLSVRAARAAMAEKAKPTVEIVDGSYVGRRT